MSNADFGWESMLRTDAPDGCRLKAALFTTYDRADERLLAEHLLPVLLKLERAADADGPNQNYFLLELESRLQQMLGRIMVVSSTSRDEPSKLELTDDNSYDWLWRSIRHFTVGRNGRAVQHAKLWLLHWSAPAGGGDEYVEIFVSSANLTYSAFKGQIQGCWKACIKLEPRSSAARLKTWGILNEFLGELDISSGANGSLKVFQALLARADCPDGITFVASVPGTHTSQSLRKTPWGAKGLRKIVPAGQGPVGVSILAPFVGEWNVEGLTKWCAAFSAFPKDLKLVWVGNEHPWSVFWKMPRASLSALNQVGATLLRHRLRPGDATEAECFHMEHRSEDIRWSHAKVYAFRRGRSRRLLVTSANFSPAAWGRCTDDGSLIIDNFELGVCIDRAIWPFDDLKAFSNVDDAVTTEKLPQSLVDSILIWGSASWDGVKISLECRCKAGHDLTVELVCGSEIKHETPKWALAKDGIRSAQIPCGDGAPPKYVRVATIHDSIRIPIFDMREPAKRLSSALPDLGEEIVQSMRDDLLFERYGGPFVIDGAEADGGLIVDASVGDTFSKGREDIASRPSNAHSYSVPALVLARERLAIVDNWVAKFDDAILEKSWLLRDGEQLLEAFERQQIRDSKVGRANEIGAKLAAEEITLRLRHLKEEV